MRRRSHSGQPHADGLAHTKSIRGGGGKTVGCSALGARAQDFLITRASLRCVFLSFRLLSSLSLHIRSYYYMFHYVFLSHTYLTTYCIFPSSALPGSNTQAITTIVIISATTHPILHDACWDGRDKRVMPMLLQGGLRSQCWDPLLVRGCAPLIVEPPTCGAPPLRSCAALCSRRDGSLRSTPSGRHVERQ